MGSGWIPSGGTPEEYLTRSEGLKKELRDAGRSASDQSNFTFAIGLEDQELSSRSAGDLINRIEQYEKAGANLACQTWEYDPTDVNNFLQKIKWYSKEVIGSF